MLGVFGGMFCLFFREYWWWCLFFLYFRKDSHLMAFGVASCIDLSTILVFLLFLRIRSFFVHFGKKKSIILWLFSHAFKGDFWAHALHTGVTEGLKIWGTSTYRFNLLNRKGPTPLDIPFGSLAHYSIWYPNVTISNFQKENFSLGCSLFLRVSQKRFNS